MSEKFNISEVNVSAAGWEKCACNCGCTAIATPESNQCSNCLSGRHLPENLKYP